MENLASKIHLRRKILSLGIIVLAVLLYKLPKESSIELLVFISTTFILLDCIHHKYGEKNILTRLYFKLYPKKPHEYKRLLSDASVFFFSTLVMMLVFIKEITVFSIVIFIIADITSHITGIILHKGKLFWNHQKTWGGLIPSFILAFITGYITIQLMPSFDLNLQSLVIVSAIISVMGTLNDYDNIAMPWGSAIFLSFFI
jgi:dolichol kinase